MICYLIWQKDFAGKIVKDLDIGGLSIQDGPRVTSGPYKRGQVSQTKCEDMRMEAEVRERERFEDAILLFVKMENGAMSQGLWEASRCWRRQENAFFPSTTRRSAALPMP